MPSPFFFSSCSCPWPGVWRPQRAGRPGGPPACPPGSAGPPDSGPPKDLETKMPSSRLRKRAKFRYFPEMLRQLFVQFSNFPDSRTRCMLAKMRKYIFAKILPKRIIFVSSLSSPCPATAPPLRPGPVADASPHSQMPKIKREKNYKLNCGSGAVTHRIGIRSSKRIKQ